MLRVTVDEARRRLLAIPDDYVELYEEHGRTVGFYVPHETDTQTPHDRDEIYVVATGSGTFVRDGERIPFGPNDLLFVAAGIAHRFEEFSDDFSTWVVFFAR